mgnify:CR=1 FL=1
MPGCSDANRLDQVAGPGGSAVMTCDYTGIRVGYDLLPV